MAPPTCVRKLQSLHAHLHDVEGGAVHIRKDDDYSYALGLRERCKP